MSIAVIIPLHNGAPWIEEALRSVVAQQLKPSEIVVVDDRSTDNGPQIAAAFPEVTLLPNPGKGSCVARNTGLSQTVSSFVAFLDQDDVWHPAHLRLLFETLEDHPEDTTVFATADAFQQGMPDYRIDMLEVQRFDPWTRFPFTIGVDGPSLALVHRSALVEVGMWEERSTGMGDALLFLKLSAKGGLLRLACRTVGKRVHAGSQWIKVRDWGARYLDFRLSVMQAALEFRKKTVPRDAGLADYERRLHALRTLRELTDLIANEDLSNIGPVAKQLEKELEPDPPELLRHTFYCLMGALFPIHDSERLRIERDRVFSVLLEAWPPDTPKTRTAIETLIGEKPLVS